MNGKKVILLFLAIIVAGVLLAFSTWRHWNNNQKTILERMRPIPPIAEFNHGSSIRSIAFSPKNPDHIASAGEGNKVKVWNINNTKLPEKVLIAHPPKEGGIPLFVNFITFSPTGKWFVSNCIRKFSFWDISSWKEINSIEIPAGDLVISPKGTYFASASNDVKLLKISDPNKVCEIILLPPKIGWESVALEDLNIANSKSERTIIKNQNTITKYRNASLTQQYKAIDFSHDGKWIAAAGQMYDFTSEKWTHKIKIWDLHRKQLFKIIERYITEKPQTKNDTNRLYQPFYSSDIRSIKFSPDNRFFAVGARNGLTIWSIPEWNIYHEILHQQIWDIAFSPDSTMYAVTNVKGITLWSVETLTPIVLLTGSGLYGNSLIEFSPDGSTLAGGGMDGVVRLWDVRNINEK
ncbi:MAG: hypothetical protein OXI67_10585 [Candidatus Poribacteria bacterium]|nr:hypothetical protein [Candidatus Poribacteria bacterium]